MPNVQKVPDPNRGNTLWLRCGQYLQPNYFPDRKGSIEISEYNTFVVDSTQAKNFTKTTLVSTFGCVVEKALQLDRMLNIIAATDNEKIVDNLVTALNNKYCENYFLSWVGLSDQVSILRNKYNDDDDEASHFRYLFSPIDRFFESFYEHKYTWAPRKIVKLDFALPGITGMISLSENSRNNLEPYFDVLYQGCETVNFYGSENQNSDLFHGGRATWRSIACGEALPLIKEYNFDRIIQKIKTTLGKIQDDAQQSLFFINHKAGIGGTTFARQLAWKLHDDYAVLDVKRYDRQKTISLIQNLYDNILGKAPIVILAEDTLPNVDNLCDDFLTVNRRCLLLIACRENNSLHNKYPKSQDEPFLQLTDNTIDSLKSRFKENSPLERDILNKKWSSFDAEVSGDIRTPFIIGLYFMEKEFNIKSYINKAIDNNCPKPYADMLACLAFCDVYNCKELPASFVNKTLGLQRGQSFLRISLSAASLVCQSAHGNIEKYYFKHHLLSEQYLKAYCQKYYSNSSDNRPMLVNLSKYLINSIAALEKGGISEDIIDVLISIIIQNKDSNEYEYAGKLSQLLSDIGMPESQRDLINHLAEKFLPYADKIFSEKGTKDLDGLERLILRLVSHAFAHLGKLYTKVPINYEKAAKYLKLAKEYMPDDDPVIYHMYGNAIYHQLLDEWTSYDGTDFSAIPFVKYEEHIAEAYGLFANACEYGSPQYGFTGQLNLLYEYLSFAYKVLGIKCYKDMKKLSPSQIKVQTLFADTLEIAKSYDGFDERTIELIHKKDDQLRSEIIMGNYGKSIEYYQNQVDKLKNSGNIPAWEAALQGLVSARIRAARENAGSDALYRSIPNPQDLLDSIQTLLQQPYDNKSYTNYVRRNSLFHHWMQLAKILNRPIDDGLIQVQYWIDGEEHMNSKKNQEPYYYQQALLYLDALDGAKRSSEIRGIASTIRNLEINQKFDPKRGRIDRIRDLIVSGTGMGKMLDITDCKTPNEIANRVNMTKCDPVIFEGHFTSVVYNNAEFTIYSPANWKGEKVHSEIGRMVKNSLSEQQLNHSVMFYAGFSTKSLYTINDSVRDQTTNEEFDKTEILALMNSIPAKASSIKSSAPITALSNPADIKGKTQIHPLKMREEQVTNVETAIAPTVVETIPVVHAPAIQVEKTTARAEKDENVLVPIGTVVSVFLDTADKSSATGHFSYRGTTYRVSIGTLKNKMARETVAQALKLKSSIRIRITGKLQNEFYPGLIL